MIDLKNGKFRDLKEINQGLEMIRVMKEQILFQKSLDENSQLAQVLQSLLDKSKTVI